MKYSIVLVIITSVASGSFFEKLRGLVNELDDYDQPQYNQGYISDSKSKQYDQYNKPKQSDKSDNYEDKYTEIDNYDNQNADYKKNSTGYKNNEKYEQDDQDYNNVDKFEQNTQDNSNFIGKLKEYLNSVSKKHTDSGIDKQADGQARDVDSSQSSYGSSHGQYHRYKKHGRKNHKNHSHVPKSGNQKGSHEKNSRKSHSHKSNNDFRNGKYGGCNEGKMFCNKYNDGFFTCNNHHYVLRACSPGTQCQQSGQNVFCNTVSTSDNYHQSSQEVDQVNNDEEISYNSYEN